MVKVLDRESINRMTRNSGRGGSTLEDKDTSLEDAFKEYEKGMKLVKECNKNKWILVKNEKKQKLSDNKIIELSICNN